VSYAWRPDGPQGDDLIAALRAREGRPTPAGGHLLRETLPGGGRVVVFDNVVAAEGRLGALLTGSEEEHGLWDPAGLAPAADRLEGPLLRLVAGETDRRRMAWAGSLGSPEVRRLDLAGELQFSDGRDGLAFLDALAGLRAPRCKTVAWRKDAAPQTVYWVADRSRQVKMRAYDKGVEAGTHGPGERVRVELQHRPPKGRRKRPATLANDDLGRLFIGGLAGWADAPYDVTRGDVEQTAAVLLDRVERGDLTRRKAASLIGNLVLLRVDGGAGASDWSRAYWLRELRDAGLVIERPSVERVVPVGARLAELRDRFAA
jgi:hypothetical protein